MGGSSIDMDNISLHFFIPFIIIMSQTITVPVLYCLTRKSKSASFRFTGIACLVMAAIAFYFLYQTGNDASFLILIGTVFTIIFCAVFLAQNKHDRWDTVIENGCYICVANIVTINSYYDFLFKQYYQTIKYSFTDYDLVKKVATCTIRQRMFGNNTVSNVFVVARPLDHPQEARIFQKFCKQEQLQFFESGIFVAPGNDPRKIKLVDDLELREKYTGQKKTQPPTPNN